MNQIISLCDHKSLDDVLGFLFFSPLSGSELFFDPEMV